MLKVTLSDFKKADPLVSNSSCCVTFEFQSARAEYAGQRIDDLVDQLVTVYLQSTLLSEGTEIWMDGYKAYLRIDTTDRVVMTLSDEAFPANRTDLSPDKFRRFMRGIIDQLRTGVAGLGLSREETLAFRHSRMNWLVTGLPSKSEELLDPTKQPGGWVLKPPPSASG